MHPTHIVERGQLPEKASKALILLHGRGGTALDMMSLAHEFCDDTFYIAAPQAAHNSWYPNSFMADETSNEPWLSSSVEIVKKLIDQTARMIPLDKIYLIGFSQGACLALEVSSRYAAKYGGVIAFTGGLIGHAVNEKKYHGNFDRAKVFIGNSDRDPHVPLIRSEQSKVLMEKLGADVTLKVYPGITHTIIDDEIAWVNQHILK